MKEKILFVVIVITLYGCTNDGKDGNNETSISFALSAKDINNHTYLNGGVYRILDVNKNVVGTYTLDKGTVDITDLPRGKYTLEEITPPDGYVAQQQQIDITVLDYGQEYAFLYINTTTRTIPQSVKVKFYSTDNNTIMGEYTAVRIGEYYWINQNFTHVVPYGADFENAYPITQQVLNKYVQRALIDTSLYQLKNIGDFDKYYGRYYSYPSILYMNQFGQIYNEYNEPVKGWKLPSPEDYRQLFAMSPFNTTYDGPHSSLNERDIRFAMEARNGDNPLAYDIQNPGNSPYKTYWFNSQYTTNMYGFNLMPGGARLNGDGPWCNGLGPDGGCYNDAKKGDLYGLFYSAYLAVDHPNDHLAIGTVSIHDYADTQENITYHMLNVRWCRRLSDAELGYKLYINSAMTDIKKLELNTPAPQGYTELPHGYIRGFYVQYILNNPNPTATVQDVVSYARQVQDNYVYGKTGII